MRKLATAALSYSAAVFAARYFLSGNLMLVGGGVMLALSFAVLFFKGKARKRVLLIALSAAVGFVWSWGHYQLFISHWEAMDGECAEISAVAADYSYHDGDYGSVSALISVDGKDSVKASVYGYNGEIPSLKPGDLFRISVKMKNAVPDDVFEADYYTSKGVFIKCQALGGAVPVGQSRMRFVYFPRIIAKRLKDAIDDCFPSDTAPLVKALLTGDKSDLRQDGELNEAMGRAGILHVVSVSGMHVSFILSFISLLTGRRRRTAAFGIPLVIIFAVITGGSPSVIRASFMQICVLIAPLLKRESDGITSMSAILAVLLLVNPRAAGSVSLQLSFAAIAGIIMVSPGVYTHLYGWAEKCGLTKTRFGRAAAKFVFGSFSSTIGAIVFSTPISALYFGYISIVSPLTNLLTLWAMSLIFSAGFVCAITGVISQAVGAACAWLVSWLIRYVIVVTKGLSGLRFAAIYTHGTAALWWLVCTYAVFIVIYFGRGKRAFRPLLPICMSVCMLCTVIGTAVYTGSSAGSSGTVTVLDVGQGQCIVIISGDAAVVIDCGSAGDSSKAASAAADYIRSRGRSSIDLLVLTHFHSDHANGVPKLMDKVEVKRIAAPCELDEYDSVYGKVMESVQKCGTELITVEEDCTVSVDDLELKLYAPIGVESVNERGVIILADFGQFEMLITGDVNDFIEQRLVETHRLPDAELLIVGHHGSRSSTCDELLEAIKPETAIISVGENKYGHPTDEVLERLRSFGIATFRTDMSGDVTVRVN